MSIYLDEKNPGKHPPFDDSKQSDLSFSLLFYKVGAYIVAYFPGNVKKKVKTNKQENGIWR